MSSYDGLCPCCGFVECSQPPANPTRNALAGLAEVMGLLGKATPGEWRFDDVSLVLAQHPTGGQRMVAGMAGTIGDSNREAANARAIAAAVNYLRSHGEAIRELVDKAAEILGMADACGCWNADADDLRAALAKFTEPRP